MTQNEKFGSFIKTLRKEKNLTQKELSEKINITDKAISKWERGLSFPDITMLTTLSEYFNISIAELLNGEREKEIKEEISLSQTDIEEKIKNAVEEATHNIKKRKEKIQRIKKTVGLLSIFFFLIFLTIQLGYIFIIKPNGYEYIHDILFYLFNFFIAAFGFSGIFCLTINSKIKSLFGVIFMLLFLVNSAFTINNGFDRNCNISFSDSFENCVVIKQEKNSNNATLYRTRIFIFVKAKQNLKGGVNGKIKYQWLTNDICTLTYLNNKSEISCFVATFGDRGSGISYYYVYNSLLGDWQVKNNQSDNTKISVEAQRIILKKDRGFEEFSYDECEQFGTTAIVLNKNSIPKYVIALNEDCELDEQTNIIKKGGTITLSEISIKRTETENLYCITYKNENDLSGYNTVNVQANSYKIKNDVLYISFNGEEAIPLAVNHKTLLLNDKNLYQISKDKTYFTAYENGVYSLINYGNNLSTFEKIKLEEYFSPVSIQFINENVGFMLEFCDVAMGTAAGRISKTTDGGSTWTTLFEGVETSAGKVFSRYTEINFINEELGFIIMPDTGNYLSDLYFTSDGNTFKKLILTNDEDFDYYYMPEHVDGIFTLKITKGFDRNSKEDTKYFISKNGINWNEIYY